MNKRIAVVAAAALISCGGPSAWVDPTSGNFTSSDATEIMSLMSGALSQVQTQAPVRPQNALSDARSSDVTESISWSGSCTPSGTVTLNGSMDANCNGTACSFSGGLQLALNSCANSNALVGNGQINFGVNGSSNSANSTLSLHETLQGGITVTRNGTAIGTCGINVTIDVSSTSTTSSATITGTVCKQPVTQ